MKKLFFLIIMALVINTSFSSQSPNSEAVIEDFIFAAALGNNSLIDKYLRTGINVNARTRFGWSALLFAVKRNDLDLVKKLLQAGADVNDQPEKIDFTPLTVAGMKGRADIIPTLLKAGAKINAQSLLGATALNFAAANGHKDAVMLLLDAGADITISNDQGKTPYDMAVERGHADIAQIIKRRMK